MKYIVLVGFFFLFTLLIWALGVGIDKEAASYRYLVFSAQLLYGNMCYDLMKSMREVHKGDPFWKSSFKVAGEVVVCLLVVLVSIYLALKVFLLTYVGFFVAFIVYSYIFLRVLPKFGVLFKTVSSHQVKAA